MSRRLDQLKEILADPDGGDILIVGGMAGNFNKTLMNHKRVRIWHNQNGAHKIQPDLPPTAAAVIFTRFIKHAKLNPLARQARRRGIPVFSLLNTGQIRKMVTMLITPEAPVAEPQTAPTTTPLVPWTEGPLKLVRAFLPTLDPLLPQMEIVRAISRAAETHGYTIAEKQAKNFVITWRRMHGLYKSGKKTEPEPRVETTPPASAVEIEPTIEAPPPSDEWRRGPTLPPTTSPPKPTTVDPVQRIDEIAGYLVMITDAVNQGLRELTALREQLQTRRTHVGLKATLQALVDQLGEEG